LVDGKLSLQTGQVVVSIAAISSKSGEQDWSEGGRLIVSSSSCSNGRLGRSTAGLRVDTPIMAEYGDGVLFSSSLCADSLKGGVLVELAGLVIRAGSLGVLKVGRPVVIIGFVLFALNEGFRDPRESDLGSVLPAIVAS
jgi:hypothetical protein